MNYKLEASVGNNFTTVAEKAKEIATARMTVVEFDFNEVVCLVNQKTNLEWLYRDYSNAWTMEWKIVGPDCLLEYNKKTQLELEKRTKINDEKRAKEDEEYRKKEAIEKEAFELKVVGIEIDLKDQEGWNKSREANKSSYGKASLDYAEGWAKLMQVEIARQLEKMKKLKHKTSPRFIQNVIGSCAKKTSHELGFLGITGFMYGCAVNILSQTWVHGEELRKWHNKDYGHEGDGVVNPALLSISTK